MPAIAHSARPAIAPSALLPTARSVRRAAARGWILVSLLAGAWLYAADPPQEVVEFFQSATRALADAHTNKADLPNAAAGFLDYFDRDMPNYGRLQANVEDLVSRTNVGSAVEFVTDTGDSQKRELDVDWVLEIPDQRTRRKVLKMTIEKRGKHWKITSLDDPDFFKY